MVSIQPKPKKGLKVAIENPIGIMSKGFNPAEAEEGFKSVNHKNAIAAMFGVSIQPKPKKGLKGVDLTGVGINRDVSIQPKPKKGLKDFRPISNLVLSAVSIQPKPKKGLKVLFIGFCKGVS